MKELVAGVVILIVVGIAGFLYRNALEHPVTLGQGACTLDAKVCPDGTSLSRIGADCHFPACPPPNIELASAHVAFVLPSGYTQVEAGSSSQATLAIYQKPGASPDAPQVITIKDFTIPQGQTANDVMLANTVKGPSGMPVSSMDAFTPVVIGDRTYQSIVVERFEGQVESAYYLSRSTDVLEFDIIERGVTGWTDPNLNISTLPEHAALIGMLGSLQSQ